MSVCKPKVTNEHNGIHNYQLQLIIIPDDVSLFVNIQQGLLRIFKNTVEKTMILYSLLSKLDITGYMHRNWSFVDEIFDGKYVYPGYLATDWNQHTGIWISQCPPTIILLLPVTLCTPNPSENLMIEIPDLQPGWWGVDVNTEWQAVLMLSYWITF